MTAFLAITDLIAAALAGAPALGRYGKVLRGRRTTLPQTEPCGLRVNAVRHNAQALDIEGDAFQWESTVVVAALARATPDQDAEAALDPLIADVFARLRAITPPPGVIDLVLDPSISIDIDEADQTVAVASVAMHVKHITQSAALTAVTA